MTAIAKDVQANIGRSAKPDWQMYLFFRVLNQTEQNSYFSSRPDFDKDDDGVTDTDLDLWLKLGNLLTGQTSDNPGTASNAFYGWLKTLLNMEPDEKDKKQKEGSKAEGKNTESSDIASMLAWIETEILPILSRQYSDNRVAFDCLFDGKAAEALESTNGNRGLDFGIARKQDRFEAVVSQFRRREGFDDDLPFPLPSSDDDLGSTAVKTGLIGVLLKLLKQNLDSGVDFVDGPAQIRSEVDQDGLKDRAKSGKTRGFTDSIPPPPPVNIGFTAPGLEFIGVDENLVATFPDVFRDGMADRAERLFDTGPSAPENWEGALGARHVHGVVWSHFEAPAAENFYWKLLRDEIKAFNDQTKESQLERSLISFLFRLIGLDVLHIELGENAALNDSPIQVPKYPEYRFEHFGFRDGISQPFVDMGLKAPGLGGGNPSRLNSWEPIAPGEIFLGHKDQDGETDNQPAMPALRDNGTYMVFRKLEQDVVGFREYIRTQYPEDAGKQAFLKAQMVGRWPNGTSLVDSPTTETIVAESQINNFRFRDQDHHGQKCPLGSHIRRSNPRDIGDRDSVKRHRILRRGMSYGGPLLAKDSKDTREKKGLLFIAMNSRIDLQFELIQARWLNGGEFLGQAGLSKCPLTGANDGTVKDRFHEAGSLSPVTGVPRFVTTKGGDYFFIPGLQALRKLAVRHFDKDTVAKFIRDEKSILDDGDCAGRPRSKGIFDAERLKKIGGTILFAPNVDAVRVTPRGGDVVDDSILFFGKYDDVREILNGKDNNGKCIFSVDHYYEAGKVLTRGDDVILGLDSGRTKEMTNDRTEMVKILTHGWLHLGTVLALNDPKNNKLKPRLGKLFKSWDVTKSAIAQASANKVDPCVLEKALSKTVKTITHMRTNLALQRVAPAGQIDLCQDFATDAAYSVIAALYGVRGPNYVTELAISLPFAKLNVGAVHRDWLAALKAEKPAHPDVLTTQVWAVTNFVSLVGNIEQRQGLKTLSRKAGSELLNHLDDLYEKTLLSNISVPKNLLECFAALEDQFVVSGISRDKYRAHVRSLLAELIVSTLALIPSTFGRLVYKCFEEDIPLPEILPKLMHKGAASAGYQCEYGYKEESHLRKFIYEMDRLEPSLSVLLRRCEQDKMLGTVKIDKGQWVGALVGTANKDESVFPQPSLFSLSGVDGFDAGVNRKEEDYLMFGAPIGDGEHSCWGRYRIALNVIEGLFEATSQLQGLRRVAGRKGEPFKFAGVTVGLNARFAAFQPQPLDEAK